MEPLTNSFRCNLFPRDNETASQAYRAETITARVGEVQASTNFTVVKVDLVVDELSESVEESVGFSVPKCWRMMGEESTPIFVRSFRVNCVPQLPDSFDIQVMTTLQGLIYTNRINQIQTDFSRGTQRVNMSATSLLNTVFFLAGEQTSHTVRDAMISALHTDSKACDASRYTSIEFNFNVMSDVGNSEVPFSLTDNQPATITVSTQPASVDVSSYHLSFLTKPEEEGEIINKPMTTDITIMPSNLPNEWRTSTLYWYGALPNKECYTDNNRYSFSLFIDDCLVREKKYRMVWPDEHPEMIPEVLDENPFQILSFTNFVVSTSFTNSVNIVSFIIRYHDFSLDASFQDVPASNQYHEEVEIEENYHKDQWLGNISSEKGGIPDCYKAEGLIYFTKQYCTRNNIDCFEREGNKIIISAETDASVEDVMEDILVYVVNKECEIVEMI